MRIGLDFGTTNSGAARFDGRQVHPFQLDPASRNPTVARSTLYITREGPIYVGQEALDRYYEQNAGRPTHLVPQHVGEIEITTGDVGTVKGYPVGPATIVRDVHVMVDELTPGRLLHALKSALASPYEGTAVFGQAYTLESLIATYLEALRRRIEAQAGEAIEGVVIGRPVHFEGARLRRAAEMAGLGQVSFELEPVAAALYYELTADAPQNILVFDFGGGTLDVTVMRVGDGGRERRVYATGGAPVAGNTFDRRIIQELLLGHLRRGSTWSEDGAPFPDRYTDALLDWQRLPDLNRPETLRFLRRARATSSDPRALARLESLIVHNDAMRLIDQVERQKIALSEERIAVIELSGEGLDLWQPVTRTQFESLIRDARRRVEACVRDTLRRSGLADSDIDRVVPDPVLCRHAGGPLSGQGGAGRRFWQRHRRAGDPRLRA